MFPVPRTWAIAKHNFRLVDLMGLNKNRTPSEVFYIIDSLAKGDYNIICKLIFVKIEKVQSIQRKYLQKMIDESEVDSNARSYLIALRSKLGIGKLKEKYLQHILTPWEHYKE